MNHLPKTRKIEPDEEKPVFTDDDLKRTHYMFVC